MCSSVGVVPVDVRIREGSAVEVREEPEKRRVRLLGRLLLVPVAGALDQHLAAQVLAEGGQHLHGRPLALELGPRHHGVARTADEERGHLHLEIREGCEQLPVAIEVPVPVQATGDGLG